MTLMPPLDLLLDVRIPALGGHLSDLSQSIVVEVVFWAVLYVLYSSLASRFLRYTLSKTQFWKGCVKQRAGVFCHNAQDDTILLIILAVHHVTAGIMCYVGARNNNPDTWRHGYLLETGFELADIFSMAIGLYPYALENIKSDIKVAMVFHHLPGILFSGLILNANLHHNEHLREIALWLLIGASVSCIAAVFTYNLSLDTQMRQATALFAFNVLFFVYCRFYIFPVESYHLILHVRNDPQMAGTLTAKCLYFAGGSLGLFNIGILIDLIPKLIRYIKRAIDGVTPIDLEDVPLSREDRMKQRRRRSSIMRAVDFVDETTQKRRSSFATVMGMNAIEDLYKLEKEAEDHEQDLLIDVSEMKALRSTMDRMQSSFKKDN